jgi:hypothetical protein
MVQAKSDRFDCTAQLQESSVVSQALIQIWEFADAPERFRTQIPLVHAGGWLAFICPGTGRELEQFLIDRWSAFGLSLARREMEDGGVVLAGPHLPHSVQDGVFQ